MAHQITSVITPANRQVIGVYHTYDDAKRAAFQLFEIAHYEHDEAVGYDAADFITVHGAVYSIDPK